MRDALSILDMCMGGERVTEEMVRAALGTADRAFLFSFAGALAERNGGEALRLIDQLMQGGRDVQVFLKDLSAHFRLLMAARLCGSDGEVLGVTGENARRYLEQAALFSQERLLRTLENCMRAEADTRWAASARSVLEIFALRICDQPESKDIDALLERISELEMRILDLEKNGVRATAPAAAPGVSAGKRGPVRMEAPIVETPVAQGDKPPKDVWNDALKYLKKFEPGIFGPLSQGKYGGYKDGLYKGLFGEAESIFIGMLNAPERKEKIENALRQCGGGAARFEAAPREIVVDPQQNKRDEKNMSGLIDMFGRDRVQIDD